MRIMGRRGARALAIGLLGIGLAFGASACAEDAGEQVRSEVEERGQSVRSEAEDRVESVRSEAEERVESVRSEVE